MVNGKRGIKQPKAEGDTKSKSIGIRGRASTRKKKIDRNRERDYEWAREEVKQEKQ